MLGVPAAWVPGEERHDHGHAEVGADDEEAPGEPGALADPPSREAVEREEEAREGTQVDQGAQEPVGLPGAQTRDRPRR